MKLKTKEILKAAREYQSNRKLPNWNKQIDADNLFAKMQEAGLTGISAIAGTYYGNNPHCKSKPLFVLDIAKDNISAKNFKDFKDYCSHIKFLMG